MTASAQPNRPRVRSHVARAVGRARHVVLDFDGVMFDVLAALGPSAREDAVTALLANREHRPRPMLISLATFGVHRTLEFLAQYEPDHAAEAEGLVSGLELDAALTARPGPGLPRLLAACAATDRKVAVVSDLSEPAVLAALHAQALHPHLGAVAARQDLDLSTFGFDDNIERAAALLGVAVTDCLVVTGSCRLLHAARNLGAVGLGCECGRDSRKHLAGAQAAVVAGLATLTRALT